MLSSRDQALLDAVLAGRFTPLAWARVRCGRVELQVSTDVLAVDGVRIGCTPPLAQALADAFNCLLPTPVIADAIFTQASEQLSFHGQWRPGADISRHEFEVSHSAAIDRELHGRTGLADTMGKHWVLCRSLFDLAATGHRCTYGAHSPKYGGLAIYPSVSNYLPGCPSAWVIQPAPPHRLSIGHTDPHHDYSQTMRLVRRACLVDGQPADLAAVLTDPVLAHEVSHEGALQGVRMPGTVDHMRRWLGTIDAPPLPPTPAADVPNPRGAPGVEWMPARHFTLVSRIVPRRVDQVVLHSTETHSRPGAARSLGRAWSAATSPAVSSHYVRDAAETVQCVDERDVAWCAPGANHNGVHVEMVGRAIAYPGPWLGPEPATVWDRPGYGLDVLIGTARLVRDICDRHDIPLERLSADCVYAGRRGITTHATVTAASAIAKQRGIKQAPWWRADIGWVGGNHCDPGLTGDRNWPWERFLAEVRGAV